MAICAYSLMFLVGLPSNSVLLYFLYTAKVLFMIIIGMMIRLIVMMTMMLIKIMIMMVLIIMLGWDCHYTITILDNIN